MLGGAMVRPRINPSESLFRLFGILGDFMGLCALTSRHANVVVRSRRRSGARLMEQAAHAEFLILIEPGVHLLQFPAGVLIARLALRSELLLRFLQSLNLFV